MEEDSEDISLENGRRTMLNELLEATFNKRARTRSGHAGAPAPAPDCAALLAHVAATHAADTIAANRAGDTSIHHHDYAAFRAIADAAHRAKVTALYDCVQACGDRYCRH